MQIFINHKPYEVAIGSTLADVLAAQGLDRPGIAVAINMNVVRREDYASTVPQDGTEITVIKAVCGG